MGDAVLEEDFGVVGSGGKGVGEGLLDDGVIDGKALIVVVHVLTPGGGCGGRWYFGVLFLAAGEGGGEGQSCQVGGRVFEECSSCEVVMLHIGLFLG